MAIPVQARPVPRITGIVLILIGLYLAIGGAWLVLLGGSLYYVVTGVALILSGVLLFRSSALALWLYAAILLGTLLWAVWEVGVDFWPLAPRGGVLVIVGIWLLIPWVSRGLQPNGNRPRLALLATLVLAFVTLGASLVRSVHDIDSSLPTSSAANSPQAESCRATQ